MLVQEIVRNHERPILLHLRRRHLQQPRAAVRELRVGRAGAQQGECQGQEVSQEYVVIVAQMNCDLMYCRIMEGSLFTYPA